MTWTPSIPQEKRDGMVAAYLAGERVVDIASRHGVNRSTLYAALRAAGAPVSRSSRSVPENPRYHCKVCGGRKRPLPSGVIGGEAKRRPTCGDPACVSLLALVPHRTRSNTGRKWKHPASEIEGEEMAEYADAIDRGDVLERDFQRTIDERLADVPESMRSFPWNPAATIPIAVMSPAGQPGEVWMRLREPAARSFVEEYCGGDEGFPGRFEVIYAWRCGCPQQTVFVVERLTDLPEEAGFYGACPRCGAVALSVEGA